MSDFAPLVDLTRNGTMECRHFGAIAVVNTQGRVLAHAGNPHWLSFTRSTLKPLQALPFVSSGGPAQMGFGSRQLAMMCASHSGEAMHVREVEYMLGRAGQGYQRLQCGCQVPIGVELGTVERAGPFDERQHNCSGKHSGFLAHCALHDLPVETYLDPQHPLQQAIRRSVAAATGVAEQDLRMGIDGCSAPNYALPLSGLARAFARLASGAQDAEFGPSFQALADAMTAHPELVSGTGRNDEAFMRVGRGDWVTKVGADGVQAVGSRSRGLGFAIKIIDANKPALHAATVELMDRLGWLDDAQRAELEPWRAREIRSVRGAVVGERRAVLELQAG